MQFAGAYKGFRGSKYFLIALVTFITTWLSLHWTVGFDADFGGINLALSIEASVGMSLFIMTSDRTEQIMLQQLAYIRDLLEAERARLVREIETESANGPDLPAGLRVGRDEDARI
ncbi:MAG: hypothetical protein KGL35_04595 [Bradyrhizobium sp.]|nr:hypothetical protein [Bradyrhizobium sp.]